MTTETEKPIEEREAEHRLRRELEIHRATAPAEIDQFGKDLETILSSQSSLRERIGELEGKLKILEVENQDDVRRYAALVGRFSAAEAKVERLRKALEEILELPDVDADDRSTIASAALRDTETVG